VDLVFTNTCKTNPVLDLEDFFILKLALVYEEWSLRSCIVCVYGENVRDDRRLKQRMWVSR
jgi:hypothetical protein